MLCNQLIAVVIVSITAATVATNALFNALSHMATAKVLLMVLARWRLWCCQFMPSSARQQKCMLPPVLTPVLPPRAKRLWQQQTLKQERTAMNLVLVLLVLQHAPQLQRCPCSVIAIAVAVSAQCTFLLVSFTLAQELIRRFGQVWQYSALTTCHTSLWFLAKVAFKILKACLHTCRYLHTGTKMRLKLISKNVA